MVKKTMLIILWGCSDTLIGMQPEDAGRPPSYEQAMASMHLSSSPESSAVGSSEQGSELPATDDSYLESTLKIMLSLRRAVQEEQYCLTDLSAMLDMPLFRPTALVTCFTNQGIMASDGTFKSPAILRNIISNGTLFALLTKSAHEADSKAIKDVNNFVQRVIQILNNNLTPEHHPTPLSSHASHWLPKKPSPLHRTASITHLLNEITEEKEEAPSFYVPKPILTEQGLSAAPYAPTVVEAAQDPHGRLLVIAPPSVKNNYPIITDPTGWIPCDGPARELSNAAYVKIIIDLCTDQELKTALEQSEKTSPFEQLD